VNKNRTAKIKRTRYPIFPMRLRPDDRVASQTVVENYGLNAMSDSFRIGVRVLQMLDLTPEKLRKLNAQFESQHPDSLKIEIPVPETSLQ